ncbi:MAG: tRNA (adenosine(37)-N6)-threonylcarbamoyltransferase complex dimerization subunit type 1 TsaB [Gammaproteobacteria bacterium]|nr:tRNA (adenosine(37)-N6)-threonylcarbamoyltransferase complex dimerization subunit type 1 TsaB [Gammaproteobacteria bacterium]
MSTRILALDTATEACSAALLVDGELLERFKVAPREHTALLLPMVDELMAEAGLELGQLDAIAFGRGPGSFTGLRIAAGLTQGLALGADLPVLPISDLAALALQAWQRLGWTELMVCQDARLQEFFVGAFRMDQQAGETSPVELWPEALVDAGGLIERARDFQHVVGSGWTTPGGQQAMRAGMQVETGIQFPRAGDIARLGRLGLARGEGLPADKALPVYLRDQVAQKPGPRKSA